MTTQRAAMRTAAAPRHRLTRLAALAERPKPLHDHRSLAQFHESYKERQKQEGVDVSILTSKQSPYKAEENPFEPLSSTAREFRQKRIDDLHADFVDAVARHRGVSPEFVNAHFGQGRMMSSAESQARNAVDGIATLNDVIAALSLKSDRKSVAERRAILDSRQARLFGHVPAPSRKQLVDRLRGIG